VSVFELVVAGILGLLGVRSLSTWLGRDFMAESAGETLLFVLNITARVGTWFVLGGIFVGYALVDEPQGLRWYLILLIGLAGMQLLTSFFLARSPRGTTGGTPGVVPRSEGNAHVVAAADHNHPPGPLEPAKRGETFHPGHPQPEGAEVESARLLANQARESLLDAGLTNTQIDRLADDYVAEDRGEDLADFIEWAKRRSRRGGGA
jgi:hypothetical protein